MPTAVIMNDTSGRGHHGCDRVSRVLKDQLTARGLTIGAIHRVTQDWTQDADFLAGLHAADVVVINGEGTIHHGRESGEALLRIVDHPDRGDTPVALVNALYQDNPDGWRSYLQKFALLSARDKISAAAMSTQADREVAYVPDLSMAEPVPASTRPRKGVLVGDSVLADARHALGKLALAPHVAGYLPVNRMRAERVPWPAFGYPARWAVYRVYTRTKSLRLPRILLAHTEAAYLDHLSSCALHVTGRFHAMAMCLVTRTPFLVLSSNSWKIEALLDEVGLDPARLIPVDQVADQGPQDLDRPFSTDEAQRIETFLADVQAGASAMFDRIAGMAAP